jgi:hypothetical protein
MPKKMRRLAIRSALSGKLADGQLVVIDELSMETPKTKEMMRLLNVVGFERSALVVTGNMDRKVLASVRNLDKTKTIPAAYLNVVDMMNHAGLLMTEEAVRVAEKLWGKKEGADGVRLAPRQKLVIEEKPPSRRSQAHREDEPAEEAPKAKAEAEEAPTGRKTKFVPKAEVEAEAPTAEAPTAEASAAEPEAEAKPKRAPRAPRAEAATETTETTEEAPKPAARRKKAEPKAEGEAPKGEARQGEAKPKRATRPKAEKPAGQGGEEKPKRRTTKKTEKGE